MGNVYVTSDLHLGHKNIPNFRNKKGWEHFKTADDHAEQIFSAWEQNIHKRDIVILLGDVIFDEKHIERFRELPGRKQVILGNHDDLPITVYSELFEKVRGLIKRKGAWLSHSPVHPAELRGAPNVHGHLHWKSLEDKILYYNACVEMASVDFPFHSWTTDIKPFISNARAFMREQADKEPE